MREFKFRGKRIDDGLLVCGNCLHQYPDGKVAISHVTKLALTFVDPDSVAQLVDYDIDKQELYEGDTVTDQYGNRYTVVLKGLADGFRHKDDPKPLVFRLVDDED